MRPIIVGIPTAIIGEDQGFAPLPVTGVVLYMNKDGVCVGRRVIAPDGTGKVVLVDGVEHGGDAVTSAMHARVTYWKPSPEELEILARGGNVCLSVLTRHHPPVMITATEEGATGW